MAKLSKRSIKLNTLCSSMANVAANVTNNLADCFHFDNTEQHGDIFLIQVRTVDEERDSLIACHFTHQDIDYIVNSLASFISSPSFKNKVALLHYDPSITVLSVEI